MKKISYLLVIGALALTSCSKKDGSSDLPQPNDQSGIMQVPSSFGRKTLVEDITGAWCGYCPIGAHFFDQLDTGLYPGKLVGIVIHIGDIMEDMELVDSTGGNKLANILFGAGVPRGTINRNDSAQNPVFWPGFVGTEVGLFPKCGLAIDASSISGHTLSLTVHTGFSSDMFSDYRLNVFIVEDDVHNAADPNYDQHNYSSATGSNPDSSYMELYMQPPIINDYHHHNVLRKLVTSIPYGDKIPQGEMVKGHDYIKSFSVNLTGLNTSHCYVVAFVDKYGTGPGEHHVQNVQKVKIGNIQGWN